MAVAVGWVLAAGLLMLFVQEGGVVPAIWRVRGHLAALILVPAVAGLCHRSWRVAARVLGLELGVVLAVVACLLLTFKLDGPFFPD